MKSLVNFIANKIIRASWNKAKQQWQGFILGVSSAIVAGASIWFLWLGILISNYYDMGNFVGSYEIAIGNNIVVARDELQIVFTRKIRYVGANNDTTLYFPTFDIYPTTGRSNYRYYRFKLGQRLKINGPYHIYTIELTKLRISSSDTTAYFSVHSKEYSQNLRPTK